MSYRRSHESLARPAADANSILDMDTLADRPRTTASNSQAIDDRIASDAIQQL